MPRISDNRIENPAWSDPGLLGPGYSQSLERGLAVLGCFSAARPVLGIADISEELQMHRSTTHRYVTTGCAASLGVRNGGEVVYLEHVLSFRHREGWMDLALLGPGSRLPADHTAIGKVLLSENFAAVEDEEFTPGLVSIAAAVRDESREVIAAAGLTASSSTISLQDLTDELGPHLTSAADQISARLGYRGDERPSARLS